jgi:hypothetical protein
MNDLFMIKYLYNDIHGYCIWFSNEKDGLLCDSNNKILCFSNERSVFDYLSQNNLNLFNNEISYTYDFQELEKWINSGSIIVNCVEILNFWNIFTDVAYTIGFKFKGDKRNKNISLIYDKLFYGNNLPVFKPENEADYIPIWSLKQVNIIRSIMENGLNIVRSNLTIFNY